MDYVLLFKAFLLGILSAGGFYMAIALLAQAFPLPTLFQANERAKTWIDNKTLKSQARFYAIRFRVTQVLMLLLWFVLALVYAFVLHNILSSYLAIWEQSLVWPYYLLAASTPSVCIFYYFIRWLTIEL